jgi:hypothetical protein
MTENMSFRGKQYIRNEPQRIEITAIIDKWAGLVLKY